MNNWLSGSSRYGPERRRGARASAPEGPVPSFDEAFSEARVCLVDNFVYVDWADGGQLTLNMRHCDQVLLGESSRRPPRRLTLRFRRDGLLPAQEESDTGMILVRVGLQDGRDLMVARDLHAHLVARFPWLDRTSVPAEAGPPAPPEEPEAPSPRYGEEALREPVPGLAPSVRPAFPPPGAPDGGPAPPDATAGCRFPERHPAGPSTGSGPVPVPAAGTDTSGDWVGFAPGPRTRELYEDVLIRRREAEGW